jgi:hypothetical protein
MNELLADLILVVHFAYVAFVVVGLILVWIGFFLGWSWVRSFAFRAAHLAAMAVVVAESLLGWECPLTTWEYKLREASGGGAHTEGFLEHWVHKVMFFQLEPATFTIIYCTFFLLLVLSFIVVRPRPPWRRSRERAPFA